ncbi:enoyl-CoA hydratase-related protein [Aestuariirhabdus litorea]|uniref:Enoyl-CoA hydratase n=1 Tax=Aestuariirhabdus litorea TaxID=2528527 RepID=A0A3P3VQ84_9GAMM|nr:enoyl-CoA hydratase-related protein [Aestuariirhabdus litorea]RRJ84108.1 enoyl-CoA hydratase [Aestuariirhabdus litorea]RWW97328.1 enoyl-CoA hydratase [Endozoicomonadaceae bacterium GTF-13]
MNLPALTDATLEIDGRVALLTFARHDVRNALTGTALVDDIVATIEWANRNPAVSVLVMTGAGSAFSAGGNIKEMAEREGRHRGGAFGGSVFEVQQKYREGIQRMPLAMESAELPVIAAINGPAIGAGFDLSCMCDIRLGCENTLLGETFINLGIIPGDGGAWFLQRLIGFQRAAELTLTGRLVKAQEALELGILLEVVEADQLLPRALELARTMAEKPPQALRMTKRLLKVAQRQPLADFLGLCASFQGMCHNTEDHLEAVNAFLEKRPGHYRGR